MHDRRIREKTGGPDLITGIRILIFNVAVPYLAGKTLTDCGCMLTHRTSVETAKMSWLPRSWFQFCISILFGMVLEWAVFEILAIPMILRQESFFTLLQMWLVVIGTVILLGLGWTALQNRREKRESTNPVTGRYLEKTGFNRWSILLLAGIIILVGFQCYMYISGTHVDWDDSRFIAHAAEAYTHGNMLNINPATGEYIGLNYGDVHKDTIASWPLFLALQAKLVGVHPTVLAHTILPPVYLIVMYCLYWLIGKCLFKCRINPSLLFTGLIAFIMLFYDAITRSQADFILVRIWQGKAVLAAIGIPLVVFVFLLALQYGENCLWILPFSVTGCCLLSSMAVAIVGIELTGCVVWYLVVTKKWRALRPILAGTAPLIIIGVVYLYI